MQLVDMMSAGVTTIGPHESISAARARMRRHHARHLVVVGSGRVVGIVSERDFVTAMARDGTAALGFDVQRVMSRIISCHSSDRVDAALATMTTARVRHLPVIDNNELKGIVSIGDLVKHRLDEKELEASVLLDISRMRS